MTLVGLSSIISNRAALSRKRRYPFTAALAGYLPTSRQHRSRSSSLRAFAEGRASAAIVSDPRASQDTAGSLTGRAARPTSSETKPARQVPAAAIISRNSAAATADWCLPGWTSYPSRQRAACKHRTSTTGSSSEGHFVKTHPTGFWRLIPDISLLFSCLGFAWPEAKRISCFRLAAAQSILSTDVATSRHRPTRNGCRPYIIIHLLVSVTRVPDPAVGYRALTGKRSERALPP